MKFLFQISQLDMFTLIAGKVWCYVWFSAHECEIHLIFVLICREFVDRNKFQDTSRKQFQASGEWLSINRMYIINSANQCTHDWFDSVG